MLLPIAMRIAFYNVLPIFLLLALSLSTGIVGAQDLNRIQADFSIKEKLPDGSSSLTMGTVFYDKTLRKTVYNIRFPEPEVIVIAGSSMYRIKEGKPVEQKLAAQLGEQSVFHLALSGHLPHFGLQGSAYTMSDMERDGEMVITTWTPPENDVAQRGKLILSQVDKQLHGLISYKSNNKDIAAKQLFRKYGFAGGILFPAEVLQLVYFDQGTSTKLTTYKEIQVNGKDDHWYDYAVPGM